MKNDHLVRQLKQPNKSVDPLTVVKTGVTALRTVRVHLIELARSISQHPDIKGFLIMPEVRLRRERLKEEWKTVTSVLRPDILSRLGIWAGRGEAWFGIPENPDPTTQHILEERIRSDKSRDRTRHVRADLSFIVLGLLIHQWLLGKGPMKTISLMEMAGCSYPAVAKALRSVKHCLVRKSYRRVELARFPKDEWARMIAVAEKARGTVRYSDRSGQPRSVESLLRRVQRLDRGDIALGGMLGAKHYYPALDLLGVPRLDLSLHCWRKEADWDFVERLDPGLERTEGWGESGLLVVHLVRRKESLFQRSADGWQYADPVECLLDLHEARLEAQASELLSSFPAARGQR